MAMEMLNNFKPDVVFSDINMPVMDGYELARQIRQRADLNGVWLVALTGYGQSSDLEKAFQAGFDRHVTKPVDLSRLRAIFDELNRASAKNFGEADASEKNHPNPKRLSNGHPE